MRLTSVKPHRGVVHTPLRYPGGKTRLVGFLSQVIRDGDWIGSTYVEPYAGGAGAALALLHDELVARIVINDLDPCIAAFWRAAVKHSDEFLRVFDDTEVTLDEWHRQREIYRARDTARPVELGYATFFLNRTNRSGIMNAGVIGGQNQEGKYLINARFNRAHLREKLVWLGEHSDAIDVTSTDGVELLEDQLDRDDVISYIDPPYFDKGSYLYMNSFAPDAHATLAKLLFAKREARWVLTYDDVPQIRSLYLGLYQGTFRLPYSAHTASQARERMVLSDPIAALPGVLS